MNQYPFLIYISIFSPILPISIGISKIMTLHHGVKILLIYIIFAFIIDVYLAWFVRGYQLALGLYHAYYLVEFIFIMTIITVWQDSYWTRRFFQILMLLYSLFWVIAKVTFEPLSGLYSVTASTSHGHSGAWCGVHIIYCYWKSNAILNEPSSFLDTTFVCGLLRRYTLGYCTTRNFHSIFYTNIIPC